MKLLIEPLKDRSEKMSHCFKLDLKDHETSGTF